MSSWWSYVTSASAPVKKEQGSPAPPPAATQPIKAMSQSFRKGVQYNMKLVILNRLQGGDYSDQYLSTPQIQVANIPWHYQDSSDIVKIEVWDVVDKAHNQHGKKEAGIKLQHHSASLASKSGGGAAGSRTSTSSAPSANEPPLSPTTSAGTSPSAAAAGQTASSMDLALDASTVNVYRNAHCAIFLFDVTKTWTFDYVDRALLDVPDSMAVLVLGNFGDKTEQRTVSVEQVHTALYNHNKRRIDQGAIKPNLIRYVDTSLMSGLGLSFIYEYLGVPFLQLMMESLKKQLELKAVEIVDLLAHLDKSQDVPEAMHRRRGQDNFEQPSDHQLTQQHQEMKLAWDNDLQAIAADYPAFYDDENIPLDVKEEDEEMPVSAATPPPPTAPARAKDARQSTLVTADQLPPMVDQFDTGALADDWFGDDEPPLQALSLHDATRHHDSDDDDVPVTMLRDQDVPMVEYYQQQQRQQQQQDDENDDENDENEHDGRQGGVSMVMVAPEDGPKGNGDSDSDDADHIVATGPALHQSPLFYSSGAAGYTPFPMTSGLDHQVWGSTTVSSSHYVSHMQASYTSAAVVPSDTDDDDETHDPFALDPATFAGMGAYEEIGASADNPWHDDAPMASSPPSAAAGATAKQGDTLHDSSSRRPSRDKKSKKSKSKKTKKRASPS
ncbi:hypothetical protein BC940DRAFT_337295 [Gongronella butleri]|nr:hypothetical protein BC940DRAFT_337295 [Gongronella butleri]